MNQICLFDVRTNTAFIFHGGARRRPAETSRFEEKSSAPDRARIEVLRPMPEVVSIDDYSRGIGHSDLARETAIRSAVMPRLKRCGFAHVVRRS